MTEAKPPAKPREVSELSVTYRFLAWYLCLCHNPMTSTPSGTGLLHNTQLLLPNRLGGVSDTPNRKYHISQTSQEFIGNLHHDIFAKRPL